MSAPLDAQRRAADPAGSVWVAANAGSGKTRVLTERVARLLLKGAPPARILCLTYTKAAAAEMRNRLFGTLGQWSMMAEGELRAAIEALTGASPPADLSQARRLFAEALETPGGLNIQTIHAFCDSLLRRFPLEADAPPGFQTLDDREKEALVAEILDEMADEDTFRAFALIASESDAENFVGAILSRRDLFEGQVDAQAIAAHFDARTPIDDPAARLEVLNALQDEALQRMIAAYAFGAKTDQKHGQLLAKSREAGGLEVASAIQTAFLTQDGDVRKSVASKGAKEAEPDWERLTDHLIEIALKLREAQLAAEAADRAVILNRFAAELIRRYERAKSATGRLDFDDLVAKTRALLTHAPMAQWALYRLDGGVDHILVDEAQDTSPAQWDVIKAISAEFHAGLGARAEDRTFFVVGDEKQSIYSFQGAVPGEFDKRRGEFSAVFDAVQKPIREEALSASFRSAPAILNVVDH
ncbi:MAG: UvrD-helicase domain-containing protein, partial [Pseudomonadota bacterium]